MKKLIHSLLSTFIAAVLTSCATTVVFDVEHPPLVDLRGVGSITIIPFEKNSSREFEHFSPYVTIALTKGMKNSLLRGNSTFIDPSTLENIPEQYLWQHVDVFLTGRITGITPNTSSSTANQTVGNNQVSEETITCTVTVYIEYSYIRARDGKLLGAFSRRESFAENVKNERNRIAPTGRNNAGGWDRRGQRSEWRDTGQFDRSSRRRGNTDSSILRMYPLWERLARLAIDRFSLGMGHELASWTTTEERNIQRQAGNDPALDEARNLVSSHRYDQALRIYQEIYKQDNNVSAGYNSAVLLAAQGKYSQALELLQGLDKKLMASGQSTPRVIRNEIQKMAAIVDGNKILDEYRKNTNTAGAHTAAVPPPLADNEAPAHTREIRGTVNLNSATVYALREAISHAADASVWTKIVASAEVSTADANALGCEWSLRIPAAAPASLWFAVSDGRSMYITLTALRTSGTVVLDTARMAVLK